MSDDCIFCKIVKGELPSTKIYENDKIYAFLDLKPVAKGHTLVIPKKHGVNVFDLGEEDWLALSEATKKLAPAIKEAAQAEGVNIASSNGEAAGQVVMHAHTHIIPRFSDDGLKLWPGHDYTEGEMAEYGHKIVDFLKE